MARWKRKIKKVISSAKRVVDKVLKHASPKTTVGVSHHIQLGSTPTLVNQSSHQSLFKHKSIMDKQVETAAKSSASSSKKSTIAPSKPQSKTLTKQNAVAPSKPQGKALAKKNAVAPTKPQSKTLAKKNTVAPTKQQSKTLAQKNAVAPTKPQNKTLAKKNVVVPSKPQGKTLAKKNAVVPSKPQGKTLAKKNTVAPSKPQDKNLVKKNAVVANNRSKMVQVNLPNHRFLSYSGIVSDRKIKKDYSSAEFSKKVIQAHRILFDNNLKKTPSNTLWSPFSRKNVTIRELNAELEQAKILVQSDSVLFDLVKNTTLSSLNEIGTSLVKNGNVNTGKFLLQSLNRISKVDNIYDLSQFLNYVSKGDMKRAEQQLKNIIGGVSGAYIGGIAGMRIGAIGGPVVSAVLGVAGSVAGSILVGTEQGREFLGVGRNESDRQAEILKQSMSSFYRDNVEALNEKNQLQMIMDIQYINHQ